VFASPSFSINGAVGDVFLRVVQSAYIEKKAAGQLMLFGSYLLAFLLYCVPAILFVIAFQKGEDKAIELFIMSLIGCPALGVGLCIFGLIRSSRLKNSSARILGIVGILLGVGEVVGYCVLYWIVWMLVG
jgi:hypothetical protein